MTRSEIQPTALLGLSLCVISALVVAACGLLPDNPSDADLERKFQEKQAEFSRLVGLCQHNPEILGMGLNETYVMSVASKDRIVVGRPDGFTEPPYQEIATLLAALELHEGYSHCLDTPRLLLFYADCGGVHPRSCKGHAYSTERLQPTAASLDTNLPSELDRHRRAYKPLSENWYILFEIGTAETIQCPTSS